MDILSDQSQNELFEKVLARLQRFLSYRERSVLEVRRYLLYKLKCSDPECEQIITFVIKEGWVDDCRFANSRINHRLGSGKGPALIRQELQSLGITRELASELLSQRSYDDVIQSGLVRAKSKIKQLQFRFDDPEEIKQRLYRYLNGRGFSYDHCQSIWEISR